MSLVYDGYSQEQLDGLLNTRLLVPDFETFTDRFTERSEATRRNVSAQLDIAYGGHPRERLDVFLPDGVASPPVNVFFHGGYWRSSDKERYSFLAESFLSFGAACITVEYALVPAVSLDELVGAVPARSGIRVATRPRTRHRSRSHLRLGPLGRRSDRRHADGLRLAR